MNITNFLALSIGIGVAEITIIPICTIKTNYQINLHYKTLYSVILDIYKHHGIYGFYSASLSAILAKIISLSIRLSCYDILKKIRNTNNKDIKNNIINGLIGGIVSSIIVHPIDVIKIYRQRNISFINSLSILILNNDSKKSHNILKKFNNFIFIGYSKSFIRNIMLTTFLFPINDFYNSKINNVLISSILASLSVTTILHPIDYLKIRHIANQNLYMQYTNITNIPNIIKYYFRGLHINLLKSVPHFAICMTVTEYMKTKLINK